MNKYWFKPKILGWGFFPISIEGWLATLVLIALIWISADINNIHAEDATYRDSLRFLLDTAMLTGIFVSLYKDKVEGGLRWRFLK